MFSIAATITLLVSAPSIAAIGAIQPYNHADGQHCKEERLRRTTEEAVGAAAAYK